MPRTTNKYTAKANELIRTNVFGVLLNADSSLSIDDIKLRSFDLTNVTNQKIAKTLNEFIEAGTVMKAKRNNHMVYKLIRENENY